MKKKNNIDGYERLKIGSNIRKWRSMKDMKQKELAAALQLSEAAVSNMENDLTDFSLSQLEDIALTLEIDIEQLFCDPREKMNPVFNQPTAQESVYSLVMDKEWIYALIGSIKEKDDQIKHALQNMTITMQQLFESKTRD